MSLHPQAEAFLRLREGLPAPHTLDAESLRAARAQAREVGLAEAKEDVASSEDLDLGGVPARLVRPAGSDGVLPVVLYLHGGGFVMGDLETHDAIVRILSNRTGWAVVAADYRRPPEHVFPAALVDSVTALDALRERAADLGLDASRIVLAGDSAGANLAIGTALRRPGVAVGALLVYPFLDPEAASASYASTSGGLDREDGLWFWRQYVPDGAVELRADPEVAPLRSTRLGELPPCLVQVAGEDTLRDEDHAFVRLAREQGAEVDVTEYDGMVHGFWRFPAMMDAAEDALAEAARWLGDLTA